MDQELIHIEPQRVFDVFTKPDGLKPLLDIVRKEVAAFQSPGVETEAGRKVIRSFAFQVAKSRTYIEGVGKKLAAEQKAIPAKIDAARRLANSTLEQLEAEVRKPLTDWEEADRARKAKHRRMIDRLIMLATPLSITTLQELRDSLDTVQDFEPTAELCEEYLAETQAARAAAVQGLTAEIKRREKAERDAAELARLRAEAERRARQDRDEAIAKAAAEKARAEVQAKHDRDLAEAARREQTLKVEAERRAENARRESEARERPTDIIVIDDVGDVPPAVWLDDRDFSKPIARDIRLCVMLRSPMGKRMAFPATSFENATEGAHAAQLNGFDAYVAGWPGTVEGHASFIVWMED